MISLRRQHGFTLLETLVSLFILSLALTSIIALLSSNLGTANSIKNSFVASSLVQEGMEVVRNLRDSDWIGGREFGSFGGSDVAPDGLYRVQWDSQALIPTSSVPSPLYRGTNAIWSYDTGGTKTLFSRTIDVKKISADEIQIIVTIAWQDRTSSKTLVAEEHLFNWY